MRIKRTAILGLFCAAAIIFSFIEHILPISFIAPGIRPGLANCVALILMTSGDTKGAFYVNIARIVLCGILFGTPVSFVFSICGGLLSLISMLALSKLKIFSVIGISIIGAVTHNIGQIFAAAAVFSSIGVFYYLPILCIAGVICGFLTGEICALIIRKTKKPLSTYNTTEK